MRTDIVCSENSTITINGQSFSGSSVNICNGTVIIDGKKQEGVILGHIVNIEIKGDCKSVDTTSGNVNVTGNMMGDIDCTSGDVRITGNVTGSVQTVSGDVKCGTVGGSVKTVSGDIENAK